MILEDPFDDPADLPVPDRSPEPTKEQLDVSTLPPFDTLKGNLTDLMHQGMYTGVGECCSIGELCEI